MELAKDVACSMVKSAIANMWVEHGDRLGKLPIN